VVAAAVREAIDEVRRTGIAPTRWPDDIAARVARRLTPSLQPVLNATGVVLHTNLGRAPLAEAAIRAVARVAAGYSTLEYDLVSKQPCADRALRVILAELAGAEDALVVNNAAAALVLALNAVAEGRSGDLAGRADRDRARSGFPISWPRAERRCGGRDDQPTHLADYRDAVGQRTGALLACTGNFEQRGFVSSPSPANNPAWRTSSAAFVYDVGSGLLCRPVPLGNTTEPRCRMCRPAAPIWSSSAGQAARRPAGRVSGGNPAGDPRLPRQSFARAARMRQADLPPSRPPSAVPDPASARREIPVLRMLTAPPELLRKAAEDLARALPDWCRAEVIPGSSAVGGGAFPGAVLPTSLVAIDPGAVGAETLARRLRLGAPPLIVRVAEDRILLDPRTLPPGAEAEIAAAAGRAGAP
jgi:L-seryl-tRNA(Ser) seleniumtransferase